MVPVMAGRRPRVAPGVGVFGFGFGFWMGLGFDWWSLLRERGSRLGSYLRVLVHLLRLVVSRRHVSRCLWCSCLRFLLWILRCPWHKMLVVGIPGKGGLMEEELKLLGLMILRIDVRLVYAASSTVEGLGCSGCPGS
jgi:hypothetical protein